jgi:signal transduction histidine kinase/ligand-binding sensor domain-containing protein
MRGARAGGHAVVTVCILLAGSARLWALNPALDISQYAHTSWKIRDGFCKGNIVAIAQTPDGYLWLGTEFGLLRFDGVRAVPWEPPTGQDLPGNIVRTLMVARDGNLWIGTTKGLASWKGGKLTRDSEFDGLAIIALLEDREGSVWIGVVAFPPPGKLCKILQGAVTCYGQDGRFGIGVAGLYEDRRGNLWVGVVNGLWRWKPGPPKLHPIPNQPDGIEAFDEADDGALLIGTRHGVQRFAGEKNETYPLPGWMPQSTARRLLRDRDGGLWIGTATQGLAHIGPVRADLFTQSGGLSGVNIQAIFEDREGTVWVATDKGLDRFREFAIPTFSGDQGLSNAPIWSVLAAKDGSVWLGTFDGLKRWNHGEATAYRERRERWRTPSDRQAPAREIFGSGLPDRGLGSLLQGDRGRIWVSTLGGVGYLENDRFVTIRGVPGGNVQSIVEDTAGNLWIANQNAGLFRISPGREVFQIPWARLGNQGNAIALAADRFQGGLWLGFYQGGVAYWKDGQIRASYSAADGLGKGFVKDFWLDRDGTLWAATESGLSRLKNGRVATLTSKNGLPCDTVQWVMEDDDQSLWLNMACGLVRVARSELNNWSGRSIQTTVFDSADGVRILAIGGFFSPKAAKSGGKIWFVHGDGVSVVDPRHLPGNNLAPPVHIEQITADRKPYGTKGGLRLPPRIRDLEIDYTALSLVAAEKVRFRYKLEGHDRDWQDADTRRQAFFNDLPPRHYRFRVIACNNSGVWNEAGAVLDFAVDPAYYQTAWFRVSCAAAFLALLGALYQLRLRQVARQFNLRLEERVNERTRIARELHDTLLQSFQGVLMMFSVVANQVPDREEEARRRLEKVIEQARQAVTEGRDAVQGLRSSTVVTNDLARAIGALGEELVAGHTGENCPEFRVHVEGASRDLAPLVRDEVHRIAGEAVRNAFRHAQAERIEVVIQYERRRLRLRILDNGKGIDRKVLAEGGQPGHHGLPGMQERAKLAGGKLAVLSRPDSGTEIELTIPASLAYSKSRHFIGT